MITLKQLKPILNIFTKQSRSIRNNVNVFNNSMYMTDLENYLEIKSKFDLNNGLHNIETIGLKKGDLENVADFPTGFDFESNVVATHKISQKDLESFFPFCSKDETRLHFNGLAINSGHFVASNGHILRMRHLEEVDNNEAYIIPIKSLKLLNKLMKKFKVKEVEFNLNEEFAIVNNEYYNLKIRLIQRDYPRWTAVVPTEFAQKFTINNWIDFKKLKPLFNNRSFSSKIILENSKVYLNIVDYDERLEIGICDSGLNFEIGFNAEYLDFICKKQNEMTFKYNNNFSPVLFENNDNRGIIMPLRI